MLQVLEGSRVEAIASDMLCSSMLEENIFAHAIIWTTSQCSPVQRIQVKSATLMRKVLSMTNVRLEKTEAALFNAVLRN